MKKRKHTTKLRKKPVTKAYLLAVSKDLAEKLEWSTNIIRKQQNEIDRLTKLTDKLIGTLDQFSRKDC